MRQNQFCSRRNWGKKHEFAWKNYVPQKVINFSSLNAYAKLNLPGNEKRITIWKTHNWYSISCYAFDKSYFGERVMYNVYIVYIIIYIIHINIYKGWRLIFHALNHQALKSIIQPFQTRNKFHFVCLQGSQKH